MPPPLAVQNDYHLAQAPRVSQVDADELDEGLVSMLGEKIERSIGNFRAISLDLKPEITFVLNLVIFHYGIFDPFTQASPGAKMQNLKIASSTQPSYRPSRRKLLLYLLLHPPIFPTYILTRLRHYALSRQWPDLPPHEWRRKAWKALVSVENAGRVWELAGWGWFLWDGRYPSLLMRMLDLRLVPSSAHLTRLVSYEYMNRQLVWGAFTEFLMFSVPFFPPMPTLFTPSALIAPIKAFLAQPTSIDYTSIPVTSAAVRDDSKAPLAAPSGLLASLPTATCPICYLRFASAPVPLDTSTSYGSAINLPPIQTVSLKEVTDGESVDGATIASEQN
ncbi:MAG: peroxisome assembly protein (Peroxin-2) [Tremellales sp. Tagirdzhanova-0007]|nr:MAG: peroxisome assembly protein (Peroxin-2) [Tremellales sp. Tagirdzhanova-0007]